MSATEIRTELDEAKAEAFLQRVFADLAAANGGFMTALGDKLGLYEVLDAAGPLTAAELAARSGCAERYVREWLNGQVAAEYLTHDADLNRYALPPEHAPVLARRDSPTYLPGAYEVTAAMWAGEERALHAFRSGEGVPWGAHDTRLFCGVAAFYRNGYVASLVPEWLPALDGVVERLQDGGSVADVGCGHGHSTILMAQAFPRSRFVGIDPHEASIVAAREHAAEAGVADRVSFVVASAQDLAEGSFDLICFFDALHDMGDPVGAALHARAALAEGGTVMLVEPNAGDALADNVGPVGRLYYAGSTVLCCAHAISEGAEDALGAQAGEARLEAVFREAGYGHWRRAAETPFNLVLEARA